MPICPCCNQWRPETFADSTVKILNKSLNEKNNIRLGMLCLFGE